MAFSKHMPRNAARLVCQPTPLFLELPFGGVGCLRWGWGERGCRHVGCAGLMPAVASPSSYTAVRPCLALILTLLVCDDRCLDA